MRPIILVVGTRPDALKLVPVYKKLQQSSIPCILYATHQHRSLLDDVLKLFDMAPDASAQIMHEGQTLAHIASTALSASFDFFTAHKPSMVVVQGDTSSSFAAALAAFYLNIPIAHIEAGLRTGNLQAPFPEEANRRFITTIGSLHFTPTPLNTLNLLHEGVDEKAIFCVGNTIVDTLLAIKQKIDTDLLKTNPHVQQFIARCRTENKKIVLLTMHRRESFSHGAARVLEAIIQSAQEHQELEFIFPTHPNPHIQKVIAHSGIRTIPQIWCCPPLAYHDLVSVLSSAAFVITDSGGIQEEASALGKRVLVLRETTERIEALWENKAMLVSTHKEAITHGINMLCQENGATATSFIYGDGKASDRIVEVFAQYFGISIHRTSPSKSHYAQPAPHALMM
ncbi:MAG: UDP-N-acetylglucosamine 2-epimerase (non-hydrolyzing) [Candidatus Babeliales bacterium]|jgi:UDP-N-acetylglucosamine 2-epimerase (non-hydrolysing)